jgi:electron transport complex protein RnfB
MKDASRNLGLDRPGVYEIRVPGRVDESWAEWFEGMTITVEGGDDGPSITTLTGAIVDEAALLGLLDRLYSLGLRLLSVKRTGPSLEAVQHRDEESIEMQDRRRRDMDSPMDAYRQLQEHLDTMPIGYPATESGVEINLLKTIFTPQEAIVATHLDYKHKTVAQIFETAQAEVGSEEELTRILDGIVAKGGISRRQRENQKQYAVLPLVLWGMYEYQLKRLTPDFLMSFGQYMQNEFGHELATSNVPKMRVIPVQESVKAEQHVATYDELRHLIGRAGDRIGIQECMCRKVADLQGKPCQATERREVCMSFGDLAELYIEEGWGRRISQEEALEFAGKNEEEGLVLMPGNEQEAAFMCACCDDCCGMLSLIKYLPKPADAVASNFYAEVNPELCTGSGVCVTRCPMDAVRVEGKVASVDLARCIGCGLCVPACREQAISLTKKAQEIDPPKTEEDLFDRILAAKS